MELRKEGKLMEICLIIEGSYPYITGGVSSWVYSLINELDEVKFKLISIMPSREEKTEYKYPIPDNVQAIKTIYLDDFKDLNTNLYKKKVKLTPQELNEIKSFFRFQSDVDWEVVAETICDSNKIGNVLEFLQSKTFWEMLLELYQDEFNGQGFNQFFWTVRSMFLLVISIMQNQLPKADIYHAVSTGYAGLLGLLAKVKHDKSFILTEHGIYAREREGDIIKATWVKGVYKQMWIDFFYFISTGAYQKADKVISLFERNRNIQLKLGAAPEKTVVIPNGINLEEFTLKKEEHQGLNIGAILRIVPIKDVLTLIKSFKIVHKKIPEEVTFYLMGPYEEDKEYYEECLRLIKKLDLQDDIIITGRVDVLEYMPRLDLLVLTSISEGQPLVILEGLAAEIPFVATDVGSCRELIEGRPGDNIGNAGIITNPTSPTEIAQAIIKLLSDENLRTEMGRNGRKRVERYYTKQKLIESYKQTYKNLG